MGGLEATEKLYFYRWSLQKATYIKGLNEQAYGAINPSRVLQGHPSRPELLGAESSSL